MDDYIDLLIKERWNEVTSAFHSFMSGPGGYILVVIVCVLAVWFIARITTKKQKHT